MAKIDKNSILHTFTGMLGRQIVVKRRLETRYMSAAPEIDPNRKPTSNQLKHQKKFTSKSAIAKRLANDPRTNPLYEAAKN